MAEVIPKLQHLQHKGPLERVLAPSLQHAGRGRRMLLMHRCRMCLCLLLRGHGGGGGGGSRLMTLQPLHRLLRT